MPTFAYYCGRTFVTAGDDARGLDDPFPDNLFFSGNPAGIGAGDVRATAAAGAEARGSEAGRAQTCRTQRPKPAAPAAQPAAANPTAGATLLGQFGDWGAYTATPGGKKVCFALGKPNAIDHQCRPAVRAIRLSCSSPPGRPRR